VSRIPRDLESLKTGFNAEAASAARFRAYAARATREGQPNLAKHWMDLAVEKDALAMRQLDAAEERRANLTDIAAAIAEESYENDVLYAKLIAGSGSEAAKVFKDVVAEQKKHLDRLEALREGLTGSPKDAPAELPKPAVARI
jgi:rubrerythrin